MWPADRERDVVSDQCQKRRPVLEISHVCLEYEICHYQQRSGECVIGCRVQAGPKGKECVLGFVLWPDRMTRP